jgi:hypothetical protein
MTQQSGESAFRGTLRDHFDTGLAFFSLITEGFLKDAKMRKNGLVSFVGVGGAVDFFLGTGFLLTIPMALVASYAMEMIRLVLMFIKEKEDE